MGVRGGEGGVWIVEGGSQGQDECYETISQCLQYILFIFEAHSFSHFKLASFQSHASAKAVQYFSCVTLITLTIVIIIIQILQESKGVW